METVELAAGVHLVPGAANTFVLRADGDRSIIVDTGMDKDYARRILRASRALGLEPGWIINTHAHADHCGGNQWLLARIPDLQVLAPAGAALQIRNPHLMPRFLYHGASPLEELNSKWTLAKPSRVDTELEPGEFELAGVRLELIEAAGHADSQLAVLVNGVLLAADALTGPDLLIRYPMLFSFDPALQRANALRLAALAVNTCVPGHGQPTQDLPALVDSNVAALDRVTEAVLAAAEGVDAAEVLLRVRGALGLDYGDVVRYHLNYSAVSAWLASLRREERVDCAVDAGRLLWRSRQLPYGAPGA